MALNLAENGATNVCPTSRPTANLATDPLVRDVDGAFMMGCSRATFWRRVADGTIPTAIKIGGMSRWRLSDIEAVIAKAESQREPAAA